MRAALDRQEVDTVVKIGVDRANDSSIPVSELGVVSYTRSGCKV